MKNLTEQLDFLEIKNKRELKELLEMMVNNRDFTFEFENGQEYRIINENKIEDIYFEEQEDMLNEVYPEVFNNNLWWVEIDMNKTIQNLLDADGYGNLFATYDGTDNEVYLEGDLFHFFRTN
jgi:antitoxin component of MazEF toxin-antitoxin module